MAKRIFSGEPEAPTPASEGVPHDMGIVRARIAIQWVREELNQLWALASAAARDMSDIDPVHAPLVAKELVYLLCDKSASTDLEVAIGSLFGLSPDDVAKACEMGGQQ